MHPALNGAFASKLSDYKFAYIEANSRSAIRRVHAFVTEMASSEYRVAADRYFVEKLMRPCSNQCD